MKTSVVSKEYKALQKEIFKLQDKWTEMVEADRIEVKLDQSSMEQGIPVVTTSSIHFNIPLYIKWVEELGSLLEKKQGGLTESFAITKDILTEENAKKWIDEVLSFNQLYFNQFAETNELPEWLPYFLAETAIRPYLRALATKVQSEVKYGVAGAGCPVCGEPVRLGQLEGEGQKVLHCPRCFAHWNDKRLTCAHCGNEDHDKMEFLTIEGDSASQIQVCHECNGYTKVIDTRQYLSKPSPALLDLDTLHLDYIAQEQGYSVTGDKKQMN